VVSFKLRHKDFKALLIFIWSSLATWEHYQHCKFEGEMRDKWKGDGSFRDRSQTSIT
jgi:hypothetical protein